MITGDGVSLTSIAHPRGPWWKSLWLWLFRRDINPHAVETIDHVFLRADGSFYVGLPGRLIDKDIAVPMEIPAETYQHLRLCPICSKSIPEGFVARAGYDAGNFRTIPPTKPRGQYCDHIPDPRGQ